MNKRQRATLDAVFEKPVRQDIRWSDIEQLIRALGGTLEEREGSRVALKLNGVRAVFSSTPPSARNRQEYSARSSRLPGEVACAPKRSKGGLMATIEYKGYIARIDVDDENDTFHGRVINVSDVINFKGKSIAELKHEFAKSMETYFAVCREDGDEPERPFSGKFVLRVDPDVHRAITRAAEREGVSINKWAEQKLQIAAHS